MINRHTAGGISGLAVALFLGTAGLGGCSLIENGNGREAFREAVQNSFYDPAYESIFTDRPPEFDSFGGAAVGPRRDGSGMSRFGEPAPYPDRSGSRFENRV